ncbi:MAG: hypothetical protein NUW06_00300 [Candidatus Acetothermia bacterium]|jgi:hypothetical protein|nr:hypothetical protein [Candidatus Acetothermia bacterium]MDH7504954.1 hypothetical protein [Candidatus Acetothermia bacterium]
MEIMIGGDGGGKALYCPLCARQGQQVRMEEGRVLIRSPSAIAQPKLALSLLQRSPLRVFLRLRGVQRFLRRHERFFYHLYFSPYRQVSGYICAGNPSHGLTRETYLKALLGQATPAMIQDEMGEIQEVFRESLWAGLS